jgi:ribosomal protein S18 acetylase RimI-like enzyme
MDSVGVDIARLTRDEAVRSASTLLAFSGDQEWEEWTVENLLAERPGKWRRSLVARSGATVVAYAIVSEREGRLHLHHLVVAPEQRSRGIGERLVSQVQKDAAAEQLQVSLKVHTSNRGAMRFYDRLGFRRASSGSAYLSYVWAPREEGA